MQEKTVKILVTTALLTVLCLGIKQSHSPLDVLIHANWAHLGVNLITLWLIRFNWKTAIAATVIGAACITLSDAVGFSAALCAATGLQWQLYDCKRSRWSMAVFFAVSAIVPAIAFLAHIVPFAIGLAIDRVSLMIKKYRNDTR